MSKKQKNRVNEATYSRKTPFQRDIPKITKKKDKLLERLYSEKRRKRQLDEIIRRRLPEIQDKRSLAKNIDRTLDGRKARVKVIDIRVKPKYRYEYHLPREKYEKPRETITCIRRKTRREVLFALKLTKKGSGSGKRTIKPESKIRC